MPDRIRLERETQNRVIRLFRNELGYDFLGDLSGQANRPVIPELLEQNLERRGYSPAHRSAALLQLTQAVDTTGVTPYQAGRRTYNLLRYGAQVSVAVGRPHETVRYIDWQNPEANDFAIAEEVTLLNGGANRRPDIVLYVNGIAVAVLELKRSAVAVGEGIRQQLSNQRDNPFFFSPVQLVLAGNDTQGLHYGTVGTPEQFFTRWKEGDSHVVAAEGSLLDTPLRQMCGKARLLDWMYDCVIFDGGIKKVPRPHQYFGLKAAQERLKQREGGVIWHTQGSGKSILMVMLAKWILQHNPAARVLVVTDREELDEQIAGVMRATGVVGKDAPSPRVASRRDFEAKLTSPGPQLLCALIHKFENDLEGPVPDVRGDFYVLVDECHRTQGGEMHRQMKRWLPGAVFVGFTGTPLLRRDRKTTNDIFGSYIHTYKFPEAVADHVVLDLKYEARDVPQELASQQAVDDWFERRTRGLSEYQKALLRRRWGTLEKVHSSEDRKQRIVRDICMDFDCRPRLSNERGTAMLVANSIYEACQYFRLFQHRMPGKCGLITSYEPAQADVSREPEGGMERLKFETYRDLVLGRDFRTTEAYETEMKRRFREEPANCRLLIVVGKLLTGFDAPSCTYVYLDTVLRDHTLFQAICRTNRLDGDDKDFGYVVDYRQQFHALQNAVAVYSSDEIEPSSGAPEDDNIHLKDWLEEGRKQLDAAREALKAHCEPVRPPRAVEDFLRCFCGDAESLELLDNTEDERLTFYKLVAAFTRAYARLAHDLDAAGYDAAEQAALKDEVTFYAEMCEAVKQFAGETLDLKPFEADMRHLIDTYISADVARTLGQVDRYSLVDLIVKTGIHDAIARRLNAVKTHKAVAEGVINNLRRSVDDRKDADPRFYERMSALLDDLLRQLRENAVSYEEFLRRAEELARQTAQGAAPDDGMPEGLAGNPAATLIYNNLEGLGGAGYACPEDGGERAALALRIDEALKTRAPANWRGNSVREKTVKGLLWEQLNNDEDATEALCAIL
ncbi:HsdR family type I site-specific deoxyribonuclease, partial [uncultured Desulfovibrio sp.]|uniref:type I restriction endonuclease subunit R n=1 Tax=uncultured Desulfovibrio sp. TaxID=167968 RepID=UPI00261184F0